MDDFYFNDARNEKTKFVSRGHKKKILLTLGSDSNCKELFIVGALGTVAQTQKEGISYWSKMTLEQKPTF